jgi:hypothetical protein
MKCLKKPKLEIEALVMWIARKIEILKDRPGMRAVLGLSGVTLLVGCISFLRDPFLSAPDDGYGVIGLLTTNWVLSFLMGLAACALLATCLSKEPRIFVGPISSIGLMCSLIFGDLVLKKGFSDAEFFPMIQAQGLITICCLFSAAVILDKERPNRGK